MTIKKLIESRDFNRSVIFGYYGGGNYGDELLLVVLIRTLLKNNNTNIEYAYMDRTMHSLLQHKYSAVPRFGFLQILKSVLLSKNIIVGGGGHWGLDANATVMAMSFMLFILKKIFRKNVYLVGVGYYESTTKLGHFSAKLAATSASVILARDIESYNNFKKISAEHTYLDKDIAFSLDASELKSFNAIDEEIDLDSNKRTIIVTIRNFRGKKGRTYENILPKIIASHQNIQFVLLLLEPAHTNLRGVEFIHNLEVKNANVFSYYLHDNPLEIVSFFKKHSSDARLIAPQYHAQLTAHLVGMDFLPLSYDNKVSQLLKQFGKTPIEIESINAKIVTKFVEKTI